VPADKQVEEQDRHVEPLNGCSTARTLFAPSTRNHQAPMVADGGPASGS
jgi:hypothetical protein